MPYANILQDIICETFVDHVGKNKPHLAMLITFRLTLDYEKEDGYRYVDLLIYGPTNYVKVNTRERWEVISVDDMENDEHGDFVPKKGKGYSKGQSEWKLWADHDSCWRTDGISRILNEYRERVTILDGFGGWYKTVSTAWFDTNFPTGYQRYALRP